MRLSVSCRFVLAMVAATTGVVPSMGCSGGSPESDAGTVVNKPIDLLSDFEEGRAIVLPLGNPVRSGFWYSYNDGSCAQSPVHGEPYYVSTPVAIAPGLSKGRALHASWGQCTGWGGGVGADFSIPIPDGGLSTSPRTVYDLTSYAGVTFWAMAMPGTSVLVRVKLVMRASTLIADKGTCDASMLGLNRCGDEWGEAVVLPSDGTWASLTVQFSDANFRPEGWGQQFPWNPADVLGIQFQTVEDAALYDFWVDDIMLVH